MTAIISVPTQWACGGKAMTHNGCTDLKFSAWKLSFSQGGAPDNSPLENSVIGCEKTMEGPDPATKTHVLAVRPSELSWLEALGVNPVTNSARFAQTSDFTACLHSRLFSNLRTCAVKSFLVWKNYTSAVRKLVVFSLVSLLYCFKLLFQLTACSKS